MSKLELEYYYVCQKCCDKLEHVWEMSIGIFIPKICELCKKETTNYHLVQNLTESEIRMIEEHEQNKKIL